MTDRKKPGVAFWTTVALVVVLIIYPLSIGPVLWLDNNELIPGFAKRPLKHLYSPLLWVVLNYETAAQIYGWYVSLWLGPHPAT